MDERASIDSHVPKCEGHGAPGEQALPNGVVIAAEFYAIGFGW
jgi:hypothetical protein